MAQNIGSIFPSLGSALGKGLAQPIHQHLDLLAQDKLMQLQEAAQNRQMQRQAAMQQQAAAVERQRYAQGLAPLLGEQAASFLSNLNPEERKFALQNLGALQQLTGTQAPSGETGFPALLPGQQQTFKEGQLVGQPTAQAAAPSDRQKLIEDLFTSPAEKRQKETLELQKQKFAESKKQTASKEKFASFKETKPERKEILDAARSAKDNLARLDEMQRLSEKGKLDSPYYLELLKKTGFDIDALKSPDTQEFQKLQMDFLRDAQNVFGSRVTNYEVSQFLKAIPSLSQSKEGRAKVINNLKIFNKAAIERSKALGEILKEHGGTPPLDLQEKVEERVAPRIDSLYKQFHQGIIAPEGKVKASFNTLGDAPASKFKGKRAFDDATGKYYRSDGTNWIEEK